MRSALLGTLLLAATMWAPSTSHAIPIDEPFEGDRSSLFEIHAGLPYIGYFGVAPGIRYGIPIVDNGFVPVIDNSVCINFGADVYRGAEPRDRVRLPG